MITQKIAHRFYFFASIMMCAFLFSTAAFAQANSYFDMTESKSGDITPFPKWTRMMDRFVEQRKIPDSECGKVRYHPCTIVDWKAYMESIKHKSLREQLKIVNDWANQYPYIPNAVLWGPEDFWETPYEFMEVSGDCKDYAIAKYYSMRALGVPMEKLRVIVLEDLNLGGVIHAVLGVYNDDDELFILDNQSHKVTPALNIYHYRPIFGINEEAWWEYHPRIN